MSDTLFSPHTSAAMFYLTQGGSIAKANHISLNALESIYAVAHNQYSNGHFEDAAKTFQYLCIYDQWSSRHFLGLASCQKMLRLYGQAIETYSFAHHLDKDNPLPLIYMGDCYRALYNNIEATEWYITALNLAKRKKMHHKEVDRAEQILATIDIPNGEAH